MPLCWSRVEQIHNCVFPQPKTQAASLPADDDTWGQAYTHLLQNGLLFYTVLQPSSSHKFYGQHLMFGTCPFAANTVPSISLISQCAWGRKWTTASLFPQWAHCDCTPHPLGRVCYHVSPSYTLSSNQLGIWFPFLKTKWVWWRMNKYASNLTWHWMESINKRSSLFLASHQIFHTMTSVWKPKLFLFHGRTWTSSPRPNAPQCHLAKVIASDFVRQAP